MSEAGRLFAAVEARTAGYGGIAAVACLFEKINHALSWLIASGVGGRPAPRPPSSTFKEQEAGVTLA
jgi:hypothetical protein